MLANNFKHLTLVENFLKVNLNTCANDVIYLHKIHSELDKILDREKRMDLYKECIKFLYTRIQLDLLEFKDDIWSH